MIGPESRCINRILIIEDTNKDWLIELKYHLFEIWGGMENR